MNNFSIEPSWDEVLRDEYQKPYFHTVENFVREERRTKNIFPPEELVFNALKKTPFDAVKVVIVGQDPYHGLGQAHGLCFSVLPGVKPPPSLVNIFKELVNDVHIKMPSHGCLEKWAEQGVLLLNAILTVQEGRPLSHQKKGWEKFTDAIIRALAVRKDPIIFLLWGNSAIKKCLEVPELKNNDHHKILTTTHPSPLSAHGGFFGCKHFSKANEILSALSKTPIDWQI